MARREHGDESMSTQSALEEPPAGLKGRAPVQGVKGQSNPPEAERF